MIVHDLPSVWQLFQDQREQTMRLLAIRHGQVPAARYYGSLPAEQINIQVLKVEFPHLLPGTLVTLLIALQSRIPAPVDCSSGEECQIGRMPVAFHKTFQIAAIPGFNLVDQQMLDCFFAISFYLLGIFRLLRCCVLVRTCLAGSAPLRRKKKQAEENR